MRRSTEQRVTYVLNTASKDPWVHGKNPHRQADYRSRYDLVKQYILPAILEQEFDEVIVAGCFEEGEGYCYIPVAPRCRDRRDALWQREIGARHATGDILVFGHDDHAPGKMFHGNLRMHMLGRNAARPDAPEWDLIVPRRIHGVTQAVLNNGFEDGPGKTSYTGGHIMVLKRWLWATVPWTSVNSEFWDCTQSRLWEEAGGKIHFATDLTHIDMEVAAGES